jgi:hypothetical protein
MKNERKGQSCGNVTRACKADDAADVVEGPRSLARRVRGASVVVAQLNWNSTVSCVEAAGTRQSHRHALKNKDVDQNACGYSPRHALRSLGQDGHGCPRLPQPTRVGALEQFNTLLSTAPRRNRTQASAHPNQPASNGLPRCLVRSAGDESNHGGPRPYTIRSNYFPRANASHTPPPTKQSPLAHEASRTRCSDSSAAAMRGIGADFNRFWANLSPILGECVRPAPCLNAQ